jgi:Gluconate 2-dehydrogenase subunit 3
MNRRDALQRVGFLMGGAVSLPTMVAILDGCKTSPKDTAVLFSKEQSSLISEIAEVIIPKTTTPGAKDAKVGEFIEMMLRDCYKESQQTHFLAGLDAVEAECKKAHNCSFVGAKAEEQIAILKKCEQDSKDEQKKNDEAQKTTAEKKVVDAETGTTKQTKQKADAPPVPFFKLAKELTLLGYFTSEPGATQALAYDPVPGRFDGCVQLTPGQKAWAN